MTPRILLFTLEEAVARKAAAVSHPGVQVLHGDIFRCRDAEVMVTAGNSFGMMDGGIDGHANYQFGMIEERVQQAIMREWHGELPVGAALVLPVKPTMHLGYQYLCYAPTMRTPRNVSKTHNAYLAARAALVACTMMGDVTAIAMPMLCRTVGCMTADDIVRQVRHAWDTVASPTVRDWGAIQDDEDALYDGDYSPQEIPR